MMFWNVNCVMIGLQQHPFGLRWTTKPIADSLNISTIKTGSLVKPQVQPGQPGDFRTLPHGQEERLGVDQQRPAGETGQQQDQDAPL